MSRGPARDAVKLAAGIQSHLWQANKRGRVGDKGASTRPRLVAQQPSYRLELIAVLWHGRHLFLLLRFLRDYRLGGDE